MQDLWDLVQKENILVDYYSIPEGYLGLYYWDDVLARGVILLDHSLNTQPCLHRCVLAEELGHHFTVPWGSVHIPFYTYSMKRQLSRDERRALKWATRFLIPVEKLAYAVDKLYLQSVPELADYFGVTEYFMHWRLGFLLETVKERYGLQITINQIFSTLLVQHRWGENY